MATTQQVNGIDNATKSVDTYQRVFIALLLHLFIQHMRRYEPTINTCAVSLIIYHRLHLLPLPLLLHYHHHHQQQLLQ
jgi:hypothetical protein